MVPVKVSLGNNPKPCPPELYVTLDALAVSQADISRLA